MVSAWAALAAKDPPAKPPLHQPMQVPWLADGPDGLLFLLLCRPVCCSFGHESQLGFRRMS